MSVPMRRWLWSGWAALVLVGGAATLYLEGPDAVPAERPHWERPSAPPQDPAPLPEYRLDSAGELSTATSNSPS